MTTIFIDGESGTTGLRLRERIANRADLKLISLPADERRSPDARLEAMKAADVTVLCLPDDAAREAVKLADEAGTRVLDASSAHRTAPEWVYGMPELMNGRAAEIARASRVSVPGCHASGFILLVAPLVSAGIIAPDAFLSATSVTGYSGGGKKMISAYETAGRTAFDSLAMPLPYAHSQTHKHLPEMTIAAGLARPPVFQPIVGSFRCGMLVTVPLDLGLLGTTKETVQSVWAKHYAGSPVVRPVEFESLLEDGALRLDAMAGHDGMKIAVSGGPHRVLLTALYDNLGKGSSGAALECLNAVTFLPDGNICTPKGFRASGIHCGLRRNKTKKDLALIVSDVPAAAAAVYTLNAVKGAPIAVTKANIADGRAQAMLCNSGNANTCAPNGEAIARKMCMLLAEASGLSADDVIIASTGVIGQPLPIEPIATGMKPLVDALSYEGGEDCAAAIMTTDLVAKHCAVTVDIGGKTVTVGGIAKGSGMIHPNMATMLVFITTDAAISSEMLQKAVSTDVQNTFNMISVDGDTSTNDMLSVMANGLAGNAEITAAGADFDAFAAALHTVTSHLSRAIARDGEGATKLLTCTVTGATDDATARVLARNVISSSLVKTAMFGSDANWGRVLCALGYSGAPFNPEAADVSFASSAGIVDVCSAGRALDFSEELAKKVLLEKEVSIIVTLHDGDADATAWGCDLSYEYVRINGDYRS